MTTIESYRDHVRQAILDRSGRPVLNGTAEHAAVIVQEIFQNARHSVKLLSNRLDGDCYARPSVRHAARAFLAGSKASAKILVEGGLWDGDAPYEWSAHPLIEDLRDFTDGDSPRLEMRRVPRNWCEAYKYNFMLLDDYGYRFESDRTRAAAVAAFLPEDADKATVSNLAGIFDRIWNISSPIALGAT